jgi:diaminopimelate decarboxylase
MFMGKKLGNGFSFTHQLVGGISDHDLGNINEKNTTGIQAQWDLVGPICETGDFLAKNRALSLSEGDYLALMSAGAYGFTMSSNYNTRPRVAEVMVAAINNGKCVLGILL